MGKPMYNFGKRTKEREKQQKQMDKAAKRMMAKQQKARLKTVNPHAVSGTEEPGLAEEIVKSIEP